MSGISSLAALFFVGGLPGMFIVIERPVGHHRRIGDPLSRSFEHPHLRAQWRAIKESPDIPCAVGGRVTAG